MILAHAIKMQIVSILETVDREQMCLCNLDPSSPSIDPFFVRFLPCLQNIHRLSIRFDSVELNRADNTLNFELPNDKKSFVVHLNDIPLEVTFGYMS